MVLRSDIPARGDITRAGRPRRDSRVRTTDRLPIIELAGIGPGPFCAMMLADMGAEVHPRRPRRGRRPREPALATARRAAGASIAVDLKNPEGVATVLRLVEQRGRAASRASAPA